MKTAVSVPDDLFAAAEEAARRQGISRSRLYTKALRDYLEAHDENEIRERLNRVYASEPSGLGPDLKCASHTLLSEEKW